MYTTSNSLVNSGLPQDVQNKRKRQPFLFPYGPPAPGLCRKSSSFLLLSLTRAGTEVVYIDNGRGRSRGRRKGKRSPKSKVSWWKKGFRHCQLTQQQEALLFDSEFPLAPSYFLIWDGYVLQPRCCGHLTEQLHLS